MTSLLVLVSSTPGVYSEEGHEREELTHSWNVEEVEQWLQEYRRTGKEPRTHD